MPITISGSTGISGTDGTASVPAIQGATANTGEFFPAANTIAWATGGVERMRVAANGNIGIGNSTPAQALSIAGALRTTAVSTNFVQSNAVAITVNTSTPTAVCSVTITTIGKPVLLLVSGDRNPAVDGNWHWGQFYRDSTAIGKQTIGQMSFASHNQPFAQCMIDTPAAGTYSYQFRVWFGQGSITYGETGDAQAPTIIAMELI